MRTSSGAPGCAFDRSVIFGASLWASRRSQPRRVLETDAVKPACLIPAAHRVARSGSDRAAARVRPRRSSGKSGLRRASRSWSASERAHPARQGVNLPRSRRQAAWNVARSSRRITPGAVCRQRSTDRVLRFGVDGALCFVNRRDRHSPERWACRTCAAPAPSGSVAVIRPWNARGLQLEPLCVRRRLPKENSATPAMKSVTSAHSCSSDDWMVSNCTR